MYPYRLRPIKVLHPIVTYKDRMRRARLLDRLMRQHRVASYAVLFKTLAFLVLLGTGAYLVLAALFEALFR